MFRVTQIQILACDLLGNLRNVDQDLIKFSLTPDTLMSWAYAEVCFKMGRTVYLSDTSEIMQMLAKSPQFFDLVELDYPSVHVQYEQYLLPPIVEVRGEALAITPPNATIGGVSITPESVVIYRVTGNKISQAFEFKTKTKPDQIVQKVEPGVYCVTTKNILGHGIPARNVEVK